MAASAACSNPHVFAHTLRFSARGFLALTKNAWFLEVPLNISACRGALSSHDYFHVYQVHLRVSKIICRRPGH